MEKLNSSSMEDFSSCIIEFFSILTYKIKKSEIKLMSNISGEI